MEDTKVDIGLRLHQLRLAKGLTVKEVACEAEVSPAFISAVEHQQSNISFMKLEKICDVLEVSMSDFFLDNIEPIEQAISHRVHQLSEHQKHALYQFLLTIT